MLKLSKYVFILLLIVNKVEAQGLYYSPYGGNTYSQSLPVNYANAYYGIGPYGQQIGLSQQLDFMGSTVGAGYNYFNNFNDLFYGGLPSYNQYQSLGYQPFPNFNQFSMLSPDQNFYQPYSQSVTSMMNQFLSRAPSDNYASTKDKDTSDNNATDDDSSDDDKDNQTANTDKDKCVERKREWKDDKCSIASGTSETDCANIPGASWLGGSCIEAPDSSDKCAAINDTMYIADVCYNKSKVDKDICAKGTGIDWVNNACVKADSSTTQKDCLDPTKHNGHAATWYHGSCWDVGCEKTEMAKDPFCVAAKKENDDASACDPKKGTWVEAKRDGVTWIEATCAAISKDNKNDEEFIFNISNKIGDDKVDPKAYLKPSVGKNTGFPIFPHVQTCLEQMDTLKMDSNVRYSSDNDEYLYRDFKNGIYGIHFVTTEIEGKEKKDKDYFVSENELIKMRDTHCAKEKALVIPNPKDNEKIKDVVCSINFAVGESSNENITYTVKFQGENIVSGKPDYKITDEGNGEHKSVYTAKLRTNLDNTDFTNLYLGIRDAYKKYTSVLKTNCKNGDQLYDNPEYLKLVGWMMSACRDFVDNNSINDLLKAQTSCKTFEGIQQKIESYTDDTNESSTTSK